MLVQLAAHIFVLVARKLFLIYYCIILVIILKFSIKIKKSTHLNNLSFVSNIASTKTSINNLNKSFFFRAI